MRKIFYWLATALAGLLALIVTAVLVLSLLDVTVDLDHLRGGVEVSAGAALGRDVRGCQKAIYDHLKRNLLLGIEKSVVQQTATAADS